MQKKQRSKRLLLKKSKRKLKMVESRSGLVNFNSRKTKVYLLRTKLKTLIRNLLIRRNKINSSLGVGRLLKRSKMTLNGVRNQN